MSNFNYNIIRHRELLKKKKEFEFCNQITTFSKENAEESSEMK